MSFEHLSFIDIFAEQKLNEQKQIEINGQNLTVEIPMLQRDYAYGRLSESTIEKRKTFLRSLKGYLEAETTNHELDFVYGATKLINQEKILILLDGQQRLTTLFLLHWFLAKCSSHNDYNNFKNLLTRNGESRFRYATRDSATAFCNALVINGDCKGLDFFDKNNNLIISKRIKDEKWFFDHWNNDPTVVNMLNMLDDIEKYFLKEQVGEYYKKLAKSGKESSITFNFLPFDEYGLTDELYIKMNSRGKPLTRFENLKSKILKSLDYLNDTNRAKKILDDVNKKKQDGKPPYDSLREYVSFVMDTKWTDVFWNFWLDTKEKNEIIPCVDDMMLGFISTFCIQYEIIRISNGQFSISKGSEETKEIERLMQLRNNVSYDDLILILTINKNCPDLLDTYEDEQTLSLIKTMKQDKTHDCILFDLILILDSLSEFVSDKWVLKKYSTTNFDEYYNEINYFKTIVYEFRANDKKARFYEEKFFFFGFINYLLQFHNSLDNNLFNDWMFFVYNLAKNSYTLVNAPYTYATCIIGLKKIISSNIYDELQNKANITSQLVTLDKNQLQEEILKSHLFADTKWKNVILDSARKLKYFEGHLFYPLINQCNITENDINNSDSIKKYQDFIDKMVAIFPDEKGCSVENALITALLSVGDYTIQVGNVKTYSLFQNDGRDISWRRLIKDPNEDPKYKTSIFTSVINNQKFDKANVEKSLIEIANNNKTNIKEKWRSLIIENPKLINYTGNNRYLRWNEANKKHENSNTNWDNWEIDLLSTTKIYGGHYELFTRALYEKLLSNTINLSPFKIHYNASTSETSEPEIKLVGWKEGSGAYFMYIKYADNDQYRVVFTYYENDNEEIPNQEVKNILLKYSYSENNTIYSKVYDEKDLLQQLTDICADFRKIIS